MPNPYDDIFENSDNKKEEPSEFRFEANNFAPDDFANDGFPEGQPEALDEILAKVAAFNEKADAFSRLLTEIRAINHQVDTGLVRYFFVSKDKHAKHSLGGERKYHDLLRSKFERIVVPMKELAQLHLETVQQFNKDIDQDYYSIEKTNQKVKAEIAIASNNINLQRTILGDAASNLAILTDGLTATERRMRAYVNSGNHNNISIAEYEIIVQKRALLTSGHQHQFNHDFFAVNLLDKTALSLGFLMKETTGQYLSKLLNVLKMQ